MFENTQSPKLSSQYTNRKVKRLVFILLIWAFSMFGFGFALVPLYDVLCNQLGFNGKTMGEARISPVGAIDYSRKVTVQLLTTNNDQLPWKFKSRVTTLEVYPGQNTRTDFFAENTTDADMTVQAIPSVTPTQAAKYLKKTECFCFTRQTLKAHQTMNMPLLFHIDRDLPKDIHTVTLAYTLFDVTQDATKNVSDKVLGRIR